MSSFVIAHTIIKDADRYLAYTKKAGPTVRAYGGEYLTKGKVVKTLVGEHNGHAAAVVKFPDQAAIQAWYYSNDYQTLIPSRDAAADVTLIIYDEPPA